LYTSFGTQSLLYLATVLLQDSTNTTVKTLTNPGSAGPNIYVWQWTLDASSSQVDCSSMAQSPVVP
jgi:hypothetical protein